MKEFQAGTDGDKMMQYWVMSVGVLAGAFAAFLLLCGVSERRWRCETI